MRSRPATWVSAVLLLCLTARSAIQVTAEEDHSGHDHGSHDHGDHHDHHEASINYEWAGVFETPGPSYLWSAQAVDGAYANPRMKMVVLPATSATESELKALEAQAIHAFEAGACVEVEVGGSITPGDKCYELHFNTSHLGVDSIRYNEVQAPAMFCSDLDSTFVLSTAGMESVAIFAEHMPTEFKRSQHYLKDSSSGEDIEPMAELQGADPPKPWGLAIGAAIVVNLVTLVGLVLLIPVVWTCVKRFPGCCGVIFNSFAAGALLAAAFLLLLYEATHLIEITDERSEAHASAAWGSMILLGFVTAPILDLIGCGILELVPTDGSPGNTSNSGGETGAKPGAIVDDVKHSSGSVFADESGSTVVAVPAEEEYSAAQSASRRRRIVGGILIGDWMHNFCDGFFIGTAFYHCGPTLGWTVTAATVYHEIAQELSDFCVLTDPKQGALRPWVAILLNFVSGTSVIIGVVLILSLDVSSFATGMILAYGGGVYVHIGAAECMSRVYAGAHIISLRFMWLLSFLVGAVGIGLVLLDHEHCSPGGGHGHGHGH